MSLEETDRETENLGEGEETPKRRSTSRSRPQSHALLGSFEESALNGRLEPVSTVHGFTAELGASGSFCPKHRKLPVTVFFYTLGDNDKVSTPYLVRTSCVLYCIFSISFEFCYFFYFLSVFFSFVILEYYELAIFHLFLCFFKLKGILLLPLLRLNDIFRNITGH